MQQQPTGSGKSSYDLIDKDLFWKALSLRPGMTVLDLACGSGRYTLPLSARLGPSGRVIAVDAWNEGIRQLRAAVSEGDPSAPIETHIADAGEALPLSSGSLDLCLMATVLHDLVADGKDKQAIAEVARVLKPDGVLAVVEFKKQEGPPGPPKSLRLSLEQVSMCLMPAGLIRFGGVVELGQFTYFAQFRRLPGRVA
jgi:ubiquinone/menaquinone biosynthesis C-methylase UbiE